MCVCVCVCVWTDEGFVQPQMASSPLQCTALVPIVMMIMMMMMITPCFNNQDTKFVTTDVRLRKSRFVRSARNKFWSEESMSNMRNHNRFN